MSAAITRQASAPAIALPSRVFMMGSVRLADPAPQLPPLEALRLYTPNYPHLANATLSPPEVRGTEVFYRIEKPPVTTKG
jgi:PRTRC genetic system protein C